MSCKCEDWLGPQPPLNACNLSTQHTEAPKQANNQTSQISDSSSERLHLSIQGGEQLRKTSDSISSLHTHVTSVCLTIPVHTSVCPQHTKIIKIEFIFVDISPLNSWLDLRPPLLVFSFLWLRKTFYLGLNCSISHPASCIKQILQNSYGI